MTFILRVISCLLDNNLPFEIDLLKKSLVKKLSINLHNQMIINTLNE